MLIHARTLAPIVMFAIACGRSPTVSDDKLGGLVVPQVTEADRAIDLDKAAKDPDELGRALAQPYRKVVAGIGPHVAKITSSSQLVGQNALAEETKIEIGDKGTFHGLYNNSADYGREAIFVDGKLYLRPRYQRWHGRAPDDADEPDRIRDQYFDAIYATWDLLAPAAQLTDRGPVQIAGRVGRKIEIAQLAKPRPLPEEKLSQRQWRSTRTIDGVTGEIVLDAEKRVVLAAKLAGNVSFLKDGKRFSMAVKLDAALDAIGTPVAIVAPATDEIVATPERLREVDDRDFLLQNIAPPIRRNPDGTAATPQPLPAGSGSAAEPAATEKKLDEKKDEKKKSKKSDDDDKQAEKSSKSDDQKADDKKSGDDKQADDKKSEDKP